MPKNLRDQHTALILERSNDHLVAGHTSTTITEAVPIGNYFLADLARNPA